MLLCDVCGCEIPDRDEKERLAELLASGIPYTPGESLGTCCTPCYEEFLDWCKEEGITQTQQRPT
jgi:hypothetical protein